LTPACLPAKSLLSLETDSTITRKEKRGRTAKIAPIGEQKVEWGRLTFGKFDAAVRDGEYDAIFRPVERNGMMNGISIVDNVVAGAMYAVSISVAALQNQYFFNSVVAMRKVTATGLHTNKDGRIARRFIAPQRMEKNPLMACRTLFDR
jgi:hypothetical protein